MKLDAYLAEVKARAESATEGPWLEREDFDYYQGGTYLGMGPYAYENGEEVEGHDYFKHDVCRIESNTKDKDFIAHARTDVPVLLEMVEALLDDRGHEPKWMAEIMERHS